MNKTVRLLKWAYYIPILLGLLMIVLFESNVFPVGILVSDERGVVEFYLEITMMLLAVCLIPVALKLLKFSSVARKIAEDTGVDYPVYRNYSLFRILVLGGMMCGNLCLYYLFMNVRFGYLAIIFFLSSVFIAPTVSRFKSELNL